VSLYVDSSALLKRYIDEPDSAACEAILRSDPELVSGRHTVVEVRRNLARLLLGADLAAARSTFAADLESISLVERTLDALHFAAAQRVGGTALPFVTYDVRQAQAARSLGFTVLGT
jgi:uncharacterized protein